MINKSLFSSNTDLWSTPQYLFDQLNDRFGFTLDPCSTDDNAKCEKHFTIADNGLLQSWSNNVVFCNPPYGRIISKWVKKSYDEFLLGADIVLLLPARTDTKWFHDFIYNKFDIEFIKGRLRFGNSSTPAPFPSMIVYMIHKQ